MRRGTDISDSDRAFVRRLSQGQAIVRAGSERQPAALFEPMRSIALVCSMAVGCTPASPGPAHDGLGQGVASTRVQRTARAAHADDEPGPGVASAASATPPVPHASGAPGQPVVSPPEALLPQTSRLLPLFADEEVAPLSGCPTSRNGHCVWRSTESLQLGHGKFWLASTRSTWEHEGMYGHELVVALLPDTPRRSRSIAVLVAQRLDVTDCFTKLSFRRIRPTDVDGDGLLETCVETVVETGQGLFELEDMDRAGGRWVPYARTRTLTVLRSAGGSVRARPAKVRECPVTGYRAMVRPPELPTPMAIRTRRQGDRVHLAPHPPHDCQ